MLGGPVCFVLTWSFAGGCEPLTLCSRQHPAQSWARRGLPLVVGGWVDRWPDYRGFTVLHAFLASVQVSKGAGGTGNSLILAPVQHEWFSSHGGDAKQMALELVSFSFRLWEAAWHVPRSEDESLLRPQLRGWVASGMLFSLLNSIFSSRK